MNFFDRWFKRNNSLPDKPVYSEPDFACSSLILLSGPSYGDKTFWGSFLLDAVAAKGWVKDHSSSVWSNSALEQQARLFLPKWLDNVEYGMNGYVTRLDPSQRQVLVPYTYDFYQKGWVAIYCHECNQMHDTLIDNTHNVERAGRTSTWTEEWLCPSGHILHHKDQEVRWIVRKPSKE